MSLYQKAQLTHLCRRAYVSDHNSPPFRGREKQKKRLECVAYKYKLKTLNNKVALTPEAWPCGATHGRLHL